MSDLELKLAAPFPETVVEWRIGRCGKKQDGSLWATCLAYVDARAVTSRLDEVCGCGGWRMEPPIPLMSENKITGFVVGISIKVDGEWVSRWDVADCSDIEPIKGAFSGAIRRCCALWSVGKYLYRLDEGFAEISTEKQHGWHYQPANQHKGTPAFYWKPQGSASPAAQTTPTHAPASAGPTDQALKCPDCGKPMRKREAKTGKNAGSFFWGCTGYPTCKKTMSMEAVADLAAQATQEAECPEYVNNLKTVLSDIGCKNAREAQAVISFAKAGLTLEGCKKHGHEALAVVEAIDAQCTFGMTFAELYNDALSQAGLTAAV